MLYPIGFLFRRLFFVLAMQNDTHFIIKLAMLWVMQHYWTTYLVAYKPFFDSSLQKLEVVNEVILTIVLMLLPLFTAYVPEEEDKYKLGWAFIGMLSFLLLLNVGFPIKGVISHIRLKNLKRKLRKERAIKRARQNLLAIGDRVLQYDLDRE